MIMDLLRMMYLEIASAIGALVALWIFIFFLFRIFNKGSAYVFPDDSSIRKTKRFIVSLAISLNLVVVAFLVWRFAQLGSMNAVPNKDVERGSVQEHLNSYEKRLRKKLSEEK